MENTAKLITALSALFGAMAWPIVIGMTFYFFRSQVTDVLARVPPLMDRMKSVKVGTFEFDSELNALADKAAVHGDNQGDVTADQVSLAASLKIQSRNGGTPNILAELDRLAVEYDTIRGAMKSGPERTHRMTRIVIQMRALGPSASDMIDRYKNSASAGNRLVAIAMMQMEPARADLTWLEQRFHQEVPFVFYHAALALQNKVNSLSGADKVDALQVVQRAFDTINAFAGQPDQNTLQVLELLLG